MDNDKNNDNSASDARQLNSKVNRIGRRDFMRYGIGGLMAASLPLGAARSFKPAPTRKKPNLLYVFPDQMRGQALGFLGQDPVLTPVLDKFAQESLVLTQAVSNYPVCSPYRAMFMSGRNPHANRVLANCNTNGARCGYELQHADRCWSDVLKDLGYSLGYIGKWHLESPYRPYVKTYNDGPNFAWNEWTPPRRRHGFDFWYAYNTYDNHMHPMYWSTHETRNAFHYVNQWGPEHEADMTIKYLRNEGGKYRDPDKPFALVVSMNPPHTGYTLHPKRYMDAYKNIDVEKLCNRPDIPPKGTKWGDYYRRYIKHYFAMITGVDEQFGRILAALKEQGLDDNTIVVFTSDHGNCLGIHDEVAKNNPYEEAMRVPFLVRWPGHIKPRQDDMLFSSIDIYPTLMDLMGFKNRIPATVDGISRAELFLTGKGDRPTSQWYMWVPYGKAELGRRGVRTSRYTLVVDRIPGKKQKYWLFDNKDDPYQMRNIADDRPGLVKKLMPVLNSWLIKYNDPWLSAKPEAYS